MPDKKNDASSRKRERLMKTKPGEALAQLLDLCGGNTALARALGIDMRTVNTWCHRGKVSEMGAVLIGETQYFTDLGWTKEKVRPDMLPHQWSDRQPDYNPFLGSTNEDIEESKRRRLEREQKREAARLERERVRAAKLLEKVQPKIEEGEDE